MTSIRNKNAVNFGYFSAKWVGMFYSFKSPHFLSLFLFLLFLFICFTSFLLLSYLHLYSPPKPHRDTSRTVIYLFNSLENANYNDIIQPVLQVNKEKTEEGEIEKKKRELSNNSAVQCSLLRMVARFLVWTSQRPIHHGRTIPRQSRRHHQGCNVSLWLYLDYCWYTPTPSSSPLLSSPLLASSNNAKG